MPIDDYTKDFFRFVKSNIGNIIGRLDALVAIAERPRQENQKTVSNETETNQECERTIRQILAVIREDPAKHNTASANKSWYASFEWWKSFWRIFKQALEAVTFIAAIGYAIFTYHQWQDANNNFRDGQKAWVLISSFGLDAPIAVNRTSHMILKFKNFGTSPAFDVRVDTHLSLEGSECGRPYSLPERHPSSLIVTAPGYEQQVGPYEITPSRQACVDQLNSQNAHLAMEGTISYKDIFKKQRTTHFCLQYEGGVMIKDMIYCEAGNSAE